MRLRHLIPCIPVIGIIYIMFFSIKIFNTKPIKDMGGYAKYYNYIDYTWGGKIGYTLSMVFQIISMLYISLNYIL